MAIGKNICQSKMFVCYHIGTTPLPVDIVEMRLIEDIVYFILLIFLLDYLLNKLGLYNNMIVIVNDHES